jgi:dTDP-4-amino-4,6-dideoxygalactose transaminase
LCRAGIESEFGFGPHNGFSASFRMETRKLASAATFVCSGRSAIGVAVRYAQRHSPPARNCVLLPSYLCHTVIQPFLELGFEVAFYPVGGDLMIDVREIARRIDRRTLAVLIMQYFGFQQDPALTQRLLSEFPDIYLIDDRTHTLLSDLANRDSCSTGAIVVYSARKWAPFPDLGIVRWPASAVVGAGEKPQLLDVGYDFAFLSTRFAALLMRSLFMAFPCEVLRRWSIAPVQQSDRILDRRCVLRSASPASLLLWQVWNWRQSWDARRRNFQYLLERWPRKAGTPLYRALSDEICPLGFPVRTSNRCSVRERLIRHQVYPPVHWLLPKQVDPGEFADSARLADEELTIPIDQRYSLTDMEHILEAADGD